jgi:putative transposase
MTTPHYRRSRHNVTAFHAHLVFVTKYRRRVFDYAMLRACEQTMRAVTTWLDVEIAEFNGESDHVHLLVTYPPSLAISVLVNRLKGVSARELRHQFTGRCNRARMRGHFWSPSYFAVSCEGAQLTIIKQYIEQQARPD